MLGRVRVVLFRVGFRAARLTRPTWPTIAVPTRMRAPCNGNGLQSMSREMHLPGIELAPLASPHDLGGIGNCSGPVEALPERIADEGARRRVVTADSIVDVPDQLLALGDGNASL